MYPIIHVFNNFFCNITLKKRRNIHSQCVSWKPITKTLSRPIDNRANDRQSHEALAPLLLLCYKEKILLSITSSDTILLETEFRSISTTLYSLSPSPASSISKFINKWSYNFSSASKLTPCDRSFVVGMVRNRESVAIIVTILLFSNDGGKLKC